MRVIVVINPHVHETGPLGPNTIFLATGFSQIYQKAQIQCILLIHARKYMI